MPQRKKPLKVGPTEEDVEAAIYHKKVPLINKQ